MSKPKQHVKHVKKLSKKTKKNQKKKTPHIILVCPPDQVLQSTATLETELYGINVFH